MQCGCDATCSVLCGHCSFLFIFLSVPEGSFPLFVFLLVSFGLLYVPLLCFCIPVSYELTEANYSWLVYRLILLKCFRGEVRGGGFDF